MAIPVWTPGTLYQPGDLVQAAGAPPALPSPPTNPGFESGDASWSKGTGFTIVNAATGPTPFSGTWKAVCSFTGESTIVNNNHAPVVPGQVINARCVAAQSATADFNNRGAVGINWYDSGATLLSRSTGNFVEQTDSGTPWRQSTVAGVAPAGAAFAAIVGVSTRVSGSGTTSFDEFSWDYAFAAGGTAGLVFKATQTNAGFSGTVEPVWPTVGGTVVDNQVTWTGVLASRVTWQASPILVSGATEPTFPTSAGGLVNDGTIQWVASTGYVVQAPNSKEVAIAASKIFATDKDIIKFSATVNPLDWTTADDAGYLPTGLQTYGANYMKVLGLYRGNLMPMNSAGFQMWQVDEDPAQMAFLDALPIGSTFHRSFQPVANDSLVVTAQGVRNISIAAGSTNLAAGSYGEPIDSLIIAAIKSGLVPDSIYFPARGQYWLWFGPQIFVLTLNGKKPSWSRYVMPASITDATLVNEVLYLRTDTNIVWQIDDDTLVDDFGGTPVEFEGVLWFPYLDLGSIGVDKTLENIDMVGTGLVNIQIGWNQKTPNDPTTFTEDYIVDADTLDGTPVPIHLTAPSLSLKLTFSANQEWEWLASILNIQDDL